MAGFPAPGEHPSPEVYLPPARTAAPLTCDPDGPLVAEVVKTTSDPYVGRVSVVRVFSGRLRPDQPLHVSGHVASFFGADAGHDDHDVDERTGVLSYPFGRHLVTAASLVAGDIGCVSRLTAAETGDTLSQPDAPAGARAVVAAGPAAAGRHRGAHPLRRGQALLGAGPAGRGGPRACGSSATPRPSRWCCGCSARRTPRWPSTG